MDRIKEVGKGRYVKRVSGGEPIRVLSWTIFSITLQTAQAREYSIDKKETSYDDFIRRFYTKFERLPNRIKKDSQKNGFGRGASLVSSN